MGAGDAAAQLGGAASPASRNADCRCMTSSLISDSESTIRPRPCRSAALRSGRASRSAPCTRSRPTASTHGMKRSTRNSVLWWIAGSEENTSPELWPRLPISLRKPRICLRCSRNSGTSSAGATEVPLPNSSRLGRSASHSFCTVAAPTPAICEPSLSTAGCSAARVASLAPAPCRFCCCSASARSAISTSWVVAAARRCVSRYSPARSATNRPATATSASISGACNHQNLTRPLSRSISASPGRKNRPDSVALGSEVMEETGFPLADVSSSAPVPACCARFRAGAVSRCSQRSPEAVPPPACPGWNRRS